MYRNQERWSIRELKEIQQQHWRQQRQSNKSKSEWREIKKSNSGKKYKMWPWKSKSTFPCVWGRRGGKNSIHIWYYLIGVAAAQAKRERENEYFVEIKRWKLMSK